MKTYYFIGGLVAALIGQVGQLSAQPPAGRIVHWGKYVGGANMAGEYQAISAGYFHALALRKDGSIAAWGMQADPNDGGVFLERCNIPSPNTGFTAIKAGFHHSLALKADGSIVSWGKPWPDLHAIPAPNSGYIAIAAGRYHSIALRGDGTIVGWGISGSAAASPPPGTNSGFTAIAAGYYHNLALTSSGTLVAWGSNDKNQLNIPAPNADFTAVAAGGDVSVGLKSNGAVVVWGQSTNQPSPNSGFVTIDQGLSAGVGVKTDGSIRGWGGGFTGEDGLYTNTGPPPNEDFIAAATSSMYSLGLKADGTVVAWGGQFYAGCNVPAPNGDFIKVSAGPDHLLGLRGDGRIAAWGSWWDRKTEVPAPNQDFIDLAAGYDFSLGLKEGGTILAWGSNLAGQCAVPSPNSGYTAIAAGWKHCLALRADQTVVAWGINNVGQTNPPAVNGPFTAVAAGMEHSLALRTTGAIEAWGSNSAGQSSVPAPNADFVAIAAGYQHSLGLKSNGTLVAWGSNNHGECNIPAPNSGFTAITAGRFFSAAIRTDGTLVCWGENGYRQCDVPTPNHGFVAVSASVSGDLIMAIERNVRYVNQARPGDGDGTTWATAFKYLQSALAVATAGEVIHVAEGTYRPDEGPGVTDNDRNATFQLKTAVTLYGGFPATGNPGFADRDPNLHPTVLSGDIDGNDTPDFGNRTGNSLHVVTGSGTGWSATLDGFTIRAGFIDTTYGGGAGMFNSNGSPTVRNCVFEDGSGTNSGGIFNDGDSPARIENCLFRDLRAGNAGGAIRNNQAGANARIADCRFENNWARWAGGAIYNFHASPIISDCTFVRNDSDGYGGGAIHGDQPASQAQVAGCTFEDNTAPDGGALYNRRGASAEVRDSVFLTNEAEDDGGAVFDSGGGFRLINCRFLTNSAGGDGGAVHGLGSLDLLLANCAAGGNTAGGNGGVLFGGAGTPATLANCSFSGNGALAGGACFIDGSAATLTLANSICWQNSAPTGPQLGVQNAGVITVGHCLLEGGLAAIHSTATVTDGGNNLAADPEFTDADGADNLTGTIDDDLSLPITSPALEAGDNAAVPAGVTTDLAGMPRLVDSDKNGTTIVDLGAYEYYNNPDLDGDGLLDSWERQIIDADPNDGIRTYADVDPNADFDNDGLANKDEYARATSPLNPDCDGDTLSDGAEVHTHSTNPLAADSDADKFGDAIEISHGMNPNASDTSLFNHVATVIGSSAVEMSAAGLYTEAAIRNLYVGTPLLAVDLAAAEVAIDLQVECSDSLISGSWQPFDFSSPDWSRTATGWLHHAPGSHCFYRIFLGERPARDDRTIR